MRSNDKGDLVVTKGDQYDVRDKSDEREVQRIWIAVHNPIFLVLAFVCQYSNFLIKVSRVSSGISKVVLKSLRRF